MSNEKNQRLAVSLEAFPDLVAIYLGTKARGLRTLMHFGPRIKKAVAQKPKGLLLHEDIVFSIFPPHVGMRQYWEDFDSLERWVRSLPDMDWWKRFTRDTGGTELWHEAYFMKGGMEGIASGMSKPIGFWTFAPYQSARGTVFSARQRAKVSGLETVAAPVSEEEFYSHPMSHSSGAQGGAGKRG